MSEKKRLDVALFERGNRVFALTRAGETLLQESEALLAAAGEAAERVRRAGEER